MKKINIGIIGYGSFGSFLAEKLKGMNLKVNSLDKSTVPPKLWAEMEDIAKCDYLILAIPFSSYPHVLGELQKTISPQAILVDVASIKEQPLKLIKQYLPNQKIIATHPLFGPQSASKSLEGHTLIICNEFSSAEETEKLEPLLKKSKLNLVRMSAIEHDQLMARLQALTFFVARALDRMGVRELPVMTPSYQKLVDLARLEHEHSEGLFKTIQTGNRFAKEIRQVLLDQLKALDNTLNNQ